MSRESLVIIAALALAASAHAQTYNIDQNLGFDTFGAASTGQTFTPGVGIVPDPGPSASLGLKEVTLYHGNYAPKAPSTTTYLNVYTGDPNAGGVFLGSSTNSIDTTGNLGFHTPMLWKFDGIAVAYATEHWLVMSSTNTAGSLDIGVSLETQDRNIVPSVYSGGTGLIANYAPHANLIDCKFNIVLEDATWVNLGQSLAGSLGSPELTGTGAIASGNAISLSLANAAPTTTTVLFIGLSAANLPLYGGTLVPAPNLFLVIPTGGSGGYTLPAVVPAGLSPGIALYFQVWIADASGPLGFTASNALTTTTQ